MKDSDDLSCESVDSLSLIKLPSGFSESDHLYFRDLILSGFFAVIEIKSPVYPFGTDFSQPVKIQIMKRG